MLLEIPQVLTFDEVAKCRAVLDSAEWIDGKITAGSQSGKVKHNLQLPEDHPVARQVGDSILKILTRTPLFMSAALPRKVYPPLFNRYESGGSFGFHVDNALREVRGAGQMVRTDLSATLFLSAPAEYDGGELVIEDTYGTHAIKLPAGNMLLYPSTSLHKVTPVTRGVRVASFFWIQSMVRDDGQRRLLFDMDKAIQKIAADSPAHPALVQLTGCYHNLLRRWADA
jgi:PKHD-type hydroxylase